MKERARLDTRHADRVQREFSRQARSFATARALSGTELVDRLVASLDAAGRGRVLDLAAGPGIVTAALAPSAREVVALDLTDETLRVARSRLAEAGHRNVRLVRADGLGLPFADAGFDAVVIRLAIHHVETPAALLHEARRVLRSGGRLAVLDLLAPEDAEDARLLCALERLRDPSHVRALREAELRDAVVDAGFELHATSAFTLERRFTEWAEIIADPTRTDALRVLMQVLASRGVQAGIGLRETDGDLVFDYRFGLVVGRR